MKQSKAGPLRDYTLPVTGTLSSNSSISLSKSDAVTSVKTAARYRRLSVCFKKMAALSVAASSLTQDGAHRSSLVPSWQSPPRSALNQHGARSSASCQYPQQRWRLPFRSHCALPPPPSSALPSAASSPSTQRWRKRLRPFEFQRSRQSYAQRRRSRGWLRAVWILYQGKT